MQHKNYVNLLHKLRRADIQKPGSLSTFLIKTFPEFNSTAEITIETCIDEGLCKLSESGSYLEMLTDKCILKHQGGDIYSPGIEVFNYIKTKEVSK